MSDFLQAIESYTAPISFLVQIIGIPIALIGLFVSARSSAKSRNLTILISLIDKFQQKWEHSWDETLRAIELKKTAGDDLTDSEVKELRYMLNWIDWLGNMKTRKVLSEEGVILDSLAPALERIIMNGASIIQHDIKTHGSDYWSGLLVVAKNLNIRLPK